MASIVRILDVSPSGTRVGVVMYSKRAENKFYLKTYQYKNEVINAILRLEREYMGSTTNTSGGLRTMNYEQFTAFNGDRPNIKNIAIVITDGESNEDEYRTISDAVAARADGITIFSIGVTDAVNAREVQEISSMPQRRDDNYWLSADFNVLERISTTVARQSCEIDTRTPAPPTVPGLSYAFMHALC
jgi:collagen type VI alpha